MRLVAKAIGISHAKFNCDRLTTVEDIQDYASLIFGTWCTCVAAAQLIWSQASFLLQFRPAM